MNIEIRQETEQIRNYVVNLRKHFHQNPELSLEEWETSKRIKTELEEMDIPFIETAGTGVIGILGHGEPVIALRADMDALKVDEKTDVGYKSCTPGVMHACGHDAHTAALLGAARILKTHEEELNCTIKLVFQPGEEVCKGAKMMMDAGYMDHVEQIFGLHVFADIPVGYINIEPGPRMAESDLFKITIKGRQGHAGKPQQCVDATVAAAATVMNLQQIVSRETNPIDAAVVNIGHMVCGTVRNVVAGSAVMEGTVRTFSRAEGKRIENAVKRVAMGTAATYHATADVEYILSAHPAVDNDPDVSEIVFSGAQRVFKEDAFIEVPKMMLGEDFSVYQQRIPGAFAFIGAGNEEMGRAYPNHHEKFNIDERAVTNSVMMYLAYVQEYVNRRNEAAKGIKPKERQLSQDHGLRGRFQKLRKEKEKENAAKLSVKQ
ncbi:amidohydrolase [Qiania dongpingensis]|uniref:Amidohydrolase n=1 Tax=Qiania dongpingensis TaxID=2763669 RepID=A0A7G9G7E9_9FIRM|nr:amidohydrolase [Qiania dongpingensis]QNM06731.1 amidohydrolase [Qiania dongpingensis]